MTGLAGSIRVEQIEGSVSMKRKGLTKDALANYLVEAFFELLDERPFSQIAVVDIVSRAGVSRSTYYRRFSTREEVAKRFVTDLLDECFAEFERATRTNEGALQKLWLQVLFTTMERSLDKIRLLVRNGLSGLFLEVMNERFAVDGEAGRDIYKLRYHLGGLYNCFIQWASDEARMPPSDMADLVIASLPKNYVPILPMIENASG